MRYDAFISYRHSELDLRIAKKLHKGLETFKVPKAVAQKSGKKNIKRVFRDQEELPIGSDLGDNIESALAQSEFLIVICSSRTPESYWVQKEIETFIKLHDREHVLAVLIEGEPEEAFPGQLLTDEQGNPVEPLAADVRGESGYERNKKLRTEMVRLAAPLLGCSYDDLRQRHRERKLKRAAAVLTAVSAGAILFGIYSAYNVAMIRQNYEGKQRNQSKYLADTSLALLKAGDRRAAVLVALEALPGAQEDKPYVAEAQYALSQALYCYDIGQDIKADRILQHEQPVNDFWLSKDSAMALTIDQGNNVYVWDMEKGKELLQIHPGVDEYGNLKDIKGAILCGDKVILCEREKLRAVSLDGEEVWYAKAPEMVSYCKFDEETMQAACVGRGQVNFYDLMSGELIESMINDQETSYSAAMAFNKEHTKFAVSHMAPDEGDGTGRISIYDFETKKINTIKTKADYINDIVFTADGHLAAVSMKSSELSSLEWISVTGYLEKIDSRSGGVLWQNTFEHQITGYEAAGAQLKARAYTDKETGKQQDEVLMSIDNNAYTWSNASGELVAQMKADSGIRRFLVADHSGIAYLAGSSGTVDIVDMTKGFRYSASSIQTNVNLRDISIKNGVLAVRAFASPDLIIYKYHDNARAIELDAYPGEIKSVQYSPMETYYAVSAYDADWKVSIFFYRTEDNVAVDRWMNEEAKQIENGFFVDDSVYVAACHDGSVFFCNVESGEKETWDLLSDYGGTEYFFDQRNCRALLYSGRRYQVVDLRQRVIVAEGETEGHLWGGILAEDGKQVYCSIKDQGTCILDVETGETELVDFKKEQVSDNRLEESAFAVSDDGRLLAICCQDRILRVLDLESMTMTVEIPFAGVKQRTIQFSKDSKQIMMQGDDYYFRVYDLEKKEFIHVSIDQYNEIKEVLDVEGERTISLITTVDMIILNRDDYERIAQIDGGKSYLPGHKRILCDYDGQMYQLPYMTLDMLRKEAQIQFEGEKLTDLERTRFHVE